MSIAIWVEDQSYELGSPSFMRCFFSTVLVRLEQGRWGSRFPIIMNEFSMGGLAYEHADQAQNELIAVQTGLEAFRPSEVVWNYEHPDVAEAAGCGLGAATVLAGVRAVAGMVFSVTIAGCARRPSCGREVRLRLARITAGT